MGVARQRLLGAGGRQWCDQRRGLTNLVRRSSGANGQAAVLVGMSRLRGGYPGLDIPGPGAHEAEEEVGD